MLSLMPIKELENIQTTSQVKCIPKKLNGAIFALTFAFFTVKGCVHYLIKPLKDNGDSLWLMRACVL